MARNEHGDILVKKDKMLDRWAMYFQELLNRAPPDHPLKEIGRDDDGGEVDTEEEPSDEEIR